MLVEGGYLHSMKQIIEKAAEAPDLRKEPGRGATPREKRSGALLGSLKRLSSILLGWDFRN